MKFLIALAVAASFACATGNTAARPGDTHATRALSCTSPMTPAVVVGGTDVRSGPDDTANLVEQLNSSTSVCASSTSEGFGFRRVQLSDGKTGYVADSSVNG